MLRRGSKGEDDGFFARGSVGDTIAQARKQVGGPVGPFGKKTASLKEPTRPETPSDKGRSLFTAGGNESRPATAALPNITTSLGFLDGPHRPSSARILEPLSSAPPLVSKSDSSEQHRELKKRTSKTDLNVPDIKGIPQPDPSPSEQDFSPRDSQWENLQAILSEMLATKSPEGLAPLVDNLWMLVQNYSFTEAKSNKVGSEVSLSFSQLLKVLFRSLEDQPSLLALKILRIGLKVSRLRSLRSALQKKVATDGSSLKHICIWMYKLAKMEENDSKFLELELIGIISS